MSYPHLTANAASKPAPYSHDPRGPMYLVGDDESGDYKLWASLWSEWIEVTPDELHNLRALYHLAEAKRKDWETRTGQRAYTPEFNGHGAYVRAKAALAAIEAITPIPVAAQDGIMRHLFLVIGEAQQDNVAYALHRSSSEIASHFEAARASRDEMQGWDENDEIRDRI